ncbi:neuferricin homolog [Drosophila tropicalis]|uniref:neuferricin homolog n=1 Tax=Drosophila tropicalis TaxID=46794 RepID=UPI0035ABF2EB
MFGFLKWFKLRFVMLAVAVLIGVYRTEIQQVLRNLTDRYLDHSDGNSAGIPVQFQDPKNEASVNLALFTPEQLATYNGENGAPIYLALLGEVFDVTRGAKHYGTGCSYNFFVGRDASVSFISGEFDEYDPETADDVLTLKPSDLIGLVTWKDFYAKDYEYKGKLIGRFYDENGQPTTYHSKYLTQLEQAQKEKTRMEQLLEKYPGCNIEWSEATGTRVWCTPTSGDGIERSWIGYPRKLYSRGSKNFQCACVPEHQVDALDGGKQVNHGDAMFKPYDDCDKRATECFYRV